MVNNYPKIGNNSFPKKNLVESTVDTLKKGWENQKIEKSVKLLSKKRNNTKKC